MTTCQTQFNKLRKLIETEIPPVILIDASHLKDKNIVALDNLNRQYHINFVCLGDNENINIRLKSIHSGAATFVNQTHRRIPINQPSGSSVRTINNGRLSNSNFGRL